MDLFHSPRFWQLGIAGVSAGLATYSTTHDIILALSAMFGVWATGSTIVRTVDRNSGVEQIPPEPEDSPKV